MILAAGLRPDSLREFTALPDPIAGFSGRGRGREGIAGMEWKKRFFYEGRGGKGKENNWKKAEGEGKDGKWVKGRGEGENFLFEALLTLYAGLASP